MAKSYYPLNFDIERKKCLVVGGGAVAERKVKALLEFGAKVFVAAPDFVEGLKRLKVKFLRRKYQADDLRGSVLIIAATDNPLVNRKVSRDAQKRGILVNVVDEPKLCSFIVPSIIKRGPLVVSISTSGRSPAFAKALRLKLQKLISPAMGRLVAELGRVRASTSSARRRQKLGA